MKDRANEGLTQAADQGRRLMETAQARVSRWSDRAQDVAGDLVGDAREQVERFTGRDIDAWTTDVRRFVQERPLQAVLVTMAVGYVLGKMLRRG